MLEEREAKIVKMRYGIDGPKYTLEQVGEEFNVTRERVRQIEQKVILKLKDHPGLQHMLGIKDEIEKMEIFGKNTKKEKKKSDTKKEGFEDEDDELFLDDLGDEDDEYEDESYLEIDEDEEE